MFQLDEDDGPHASRVWDAVGSHLVLLLMWLAAFLIVGWALGAFGE